MSVIGEMDEFIKSLVTIEELDKILKEIDEEEDVKPLLENIHATVKQESISSKAKQEKSFPCKKPKMHTMDPIEHPFAKNAVSAKARRERNKLQNLELQVKMELVLEEQRKLQTLVLQVESIFETRNQLCRDEWYKIRQNLFIT